MYDAENQILKALPVMAKAASRAELRRAFEDHYKETKSQVDRLDRIFKALNEEPSKFKCEPVTAIVDQGASLMSEKASDSAVVDAGLITIAQKVEHFEIASYGCARTHARLLGYERIAELLEVTLKEEENADMKLTAIAESKVNIDAGKAPYAKARTAPRLAEAQGSGGGMGRVLVGLGIGAAIALLYAPKPGEETREDLLNKANEGKEYLKRRSEEVRRSAEDLMEKGRQTANETLQAGKDAVRENNGINAAGM
ncbi:MAG: DUF892 family protein [Acidobacteriota bacterium]|nr:DUF892 family protein [Acidobacteriota bacterium]